MSNELGFYINGVWRSPAQPNSKTIKVINPSTEELIASVACGSRADVDAAVNSAVHGFEIWSQSSRAERARVLEKIIDQYESRMDDLAAMMSQEMGAPASLAKNGQAAAGLSHFRAALNVLANYEFESMEGKDRIWREPIGVCGLITPWNWPMNQIASKVAPAIATGCAMVLKPSEMTPFSANIFAEILHDADVPPGVFNLVNGDGPETGRAICEHDQIDMISFTGSTQAGIEIARSAAASIKRVTQELGGKSAQIVLDDAEFERAVSFCASSVFLNSGQSCNAPTRLLVPKNKIEEAASIAHKCAQSVKVGPANDHDANMGPVVSKIQRDRIIELIRSGIDQGATLVCGGPSRPDGLQAGYFVRPTVFCHVDNKMRIAQEEIFGPVLSIISYDSDDEAIKIANDSPYGLAAYVWGSNHARIQNFVSRLRVGSISVNGTGPGVTAPFGGFKQSGNGRERGAHGFLEFQELKSVGGLS